jgi:hypothetical protein
VIGNRWKVADIAKLKAAARKKQVKTVISAIEADLYRGSRIWCRRIAVGMVNSDGRRCV